MGEHFRRYILVNTGMILGSFLIFGLIFYLLSQSFSSKAEQILSYRAAILQHSSDLQNLSDLKTRSAAAAEFQKKMDAALPPQDGLISFPQFMTNLAKNYSLSLTFNFDGSPVPSPPPAPGYVEFSSSIQGPSENIRRFLDELENKTTRFMVNISGLVLTPTSDIYRADIKGRVFFK